MIIFILPITVFLILTTACRASDHTPFFRRSTSLVNESVSILATANLTYELGLTDFKFVGREHTLGIGGTIGYAFTGSLCAPIVAQAFVFMVEYLLMASWEECTALLPQRLLRLNPCMHYSWAYYSSARATEG